MAPFSKLDSPLRHFSFLDADQIIIKQEDLEKNSRCTLPEQKIPEIIIYPKNENEIQQIVKVANELKIPIWYVSTGKNWGYGCKTAAYDGGITLILERLNKIHEVNADLGYAVIEPGVTYENLNNYLKDNNIPLWTDSAGSTKSASIIGNALDKGRGLTPYADHFGMLCGMDIILPSGEKLELAPTDNFNCKYTYKWNIGPYLEGLFTQSNFGIVSKAGIWLMPAPDDFDFFAFEYTASTKDFPNFIDDFRRLFFSQGITSRPHLANDFAMLCIVDKYPKHILQNKEKYLSQQQLQQWKKKHGIKDWTFGGGLYGTKKQISAQKELVKKYLSPYGTIRFIGYGVKDTFYGRLFRKLVLLAAKIDGKSNEFIQQIFPAIDLFRGKPTDDFAKQVYFKSDMPRPEGNFNPANDNCGFIWTGPLVPFEATHIDKVLQTAKDIFKTYEFDFFVELIIESPRTVIVLFGVFFTPNIAEEKERAQNWYKCMRHEMTQLGYSAYRETSSSTTLTLDNNEKLRSFLAKIKAALDKNNILAPGRYGISANSNEEIN